MNVRFQQYSVNQTSSTENDQINYYEEIDKFNIKADEINNGTTQSTNEDLAPQESNVKFFKTDVNKNIEVQNSDVIAPNILDKGNDIYIITKRMLSTCIVVWIVLIIFFVAILMIIITIFTGNKELKSKINFNII
jgi:hypothetical protein